MLRALVWWLALSPVAALLLGATIRHLRRHGLPERIEPHLPCEWALWITSWPFAEYVRHDWPGASGRCYRKAGFRLVGRTKGGLLAWQMLPEEMPEPLAPLPASGALMAV